MSSNVDATPRASTHSFGCFDIVPLLPESVVQAYLASVTRRAYPAGRTIYSQGDAATAMCRIVTGEVRLSLIGHDGREIVYIHYGPRDCFGYSDLIDGKGLPHTAEASSDVEVEVLNRAGFRALRAQHGFDAALLYLMCGYMRRLSDEVAGATLAGLPNRLARRLLLEARPDGRGRPIVKMPQSEIGLMIGATRQWVNKLLRELEHDGIVELAYGAVILRDPAALEQRAGSVY